VNSKIFLRGIIFFLISILLLPTSGTLTANAAGLESNLEAITVPTPKKPSGMIFDRTPTYKWTKINNATAYQYQLWQGTTIIYTKTTGSACGATICARTPTNVLGYTDYKWRVRAKVGGVWRPWSGYLVFNIHNPMVPILVAPDGTIFDRTPTYKWKKVNNATAYRYQLWQGTTLVYTKTTGSTCGTTTCARTPTVKLAYNNYKWRARAKVGGVWKPWSTYYNFALNNPNVPKPLSPAGPTYDDPPTFTWTRAKDVKNYQIQLYKGTNQIYTLTYDATCGSVTCSRTPSNMLVFGYYKWRVRVQKLNGVWKPWSLWKKFKNNVQYNDFNTNHNGWSVYGGDGTWYHENSQFYTSTGVLDKWSNIGFDTRTYSDITIEVKMKRTGGQNIDANRLIIRGDPTLDANNDWASGYAFQYANNGTFSVYNGSNPLKGWSTPTLNPIKPNDWNILKVVANGSSLKFYINGTLLWSGTDGSLSDGTVGIGFIWSGASFPSTFEVDWAKFSDYVAPADAMMDEWIVPSVEIPGGSSTSAPSLPK